MRHRGNDRTLRVAHPFGAGECAPRQQPDNSAQELASSRAELDAAAFYRSALTAARAVIYASNTIGRKPLLRSFVPMEPARCRGRAPRWPSHGATNSGVSSRGLVTG